MARKLVISFTGLLGRIRSGKTTAEDLADALFYFGCIREHVLQPGAAGEANELEWFTHDLEGEEAEAERLRIHTIVVEAVQKAEQDGRAAFRKLDERNSYARLNDLLAANGLPTLRDTWDYNYPAIEEQVAEQGIPLEVVWR